MIRRISIFLVCISGCFNINLTLAQQISGQLFNTKSNSFEAAAEVYLLNTPFTTYTNALGKFRFSNVPEGSYVLMVNLNQNLIEIQS